MSEILVEIGPTELEQLTQLEPTLQVKVPLYEGDGRTRATDSNGAEQVGNFTLTRPTPAEGIAFGKFLQGDAPDDAPSQQAIAIQAVKYALPHYRNSSDGDVLLVLVQTGGYLGENAVLANACLGVLGINLKASQAEPEKRWATDEQLPG